MKNPNSIRDTRIALLSTKRDKEIFRSIASENGLDLGPWILTTLINTEAYKLKSNGPKTN